VHVEIVAPDGNPVASGELGRIRIRAPSGPLPFFGLDEWQRKSRIQCFCPGDVGSFDSRGRLIVHGREDNVINIGGTKTTPESLEQLILAAPGIRDCGVVCKPDEYGIDRITALIVVNPSWDQAKFLSYCQANILRDFLPSKFVLVKQIPRTRSLKIDREQLVKLA
jgi:acyl-coenzyme A synthetase/AMP-(fatty) acid ligase